MDSAGGHGAGGAPETDQIAGAPLTCWAWSVLSFISRSTLRHGCGSFSKRTPGEGVGGEDLAGPEGKEPTVFLSFEVNVLSFLLLSVCLKSGHTMHLGVFCPPEL